MPKQFEVRYRWSFLDFETRAEIFDGERWVRLSREANERLMAQMAQNGN